ncbi:MAG: hypothetical protein WED05_04935 [Candidatus Atabeyarchaeum deiterrae]
MSEILRPQHETLLLMLKCSNGQIRGIKRLQKLIFLSQHKGAIDDEAKFIFAPYLRGPFSTDCMDALNELSQEGYVQIRKISDDRHRGFHVIQLTDKGTNAANLVRPNKEIGNLIEHYSAVDTDRLTEESYKEFYRAITPTMLYVNTPGIDEVTSYPSSPHWRSNIGERIKLSVPISRTAALGEKDAGKLERIRDRAAVFTSTSQILEDWKFRKIVPGCIVRTYGVFHNISPAALGLLGKFSQSLVSPRDSVLDVIIDAFGKFFFVDDEAETLLTYVVELCAEVGVSATQLVLNALYILGYEAMKRARTSDPALRMIGSNRDAELGFKRADEHFDPSTMFT